jgi:hypothetical protein
MLKIRGMKTTMANDNKFILVLWKQENTGEYWMHILTKRLMFNLTMLAIISATGLAQVQSIDDSANDASRHEAYTSRATFIQENTTVAANASMQSAATIPEADGLKSPALNLNYIWSVTGIESNQVIMALNQEGKDLYGRAKYEPDSGQAWNGVVVGSTKNDEVDLVLTAVSNGNQFTSRLTGTFDSASQSIKGNFLMIQKGQISDRGDFEAIWINPDTSSYTPAIVEGPEITPSAPTRDSDRSVLPEDGKDSLQASMQKSRYHDVHEDADRILTGVGDISQIPIGMGGSGLS